MGNEEHADKHIVVDLLGNILEIIYGYASKWGHHFGPSPSGVRGYKPDLP